MRAVKLIFVTLGCVFLQEHFLGVIRPLAVLPNLGLILIIYAGLSATASETVAMAIGAGLLLDLDSGVDFGLRMALFSTIGLVIIVLRRAGADFENFGLVLVATILGTIAYNLAVVAGLLGGGNRLPWGFMSRQIGIELVINLILAVVLGPILAKLLKLQIGQAIAVGRGR